MSYDYASYAGTIKTKAISFKEEKELLKRLDQDEWTELNEVQSVDAFDHYGFEVYVSEVKKRKRVYTFKLDGDNAYYEEDVRFFLNAIAPYTEEGEIKMQSEDPEACRFQYRNAAWRFQFRNGAWYKDNGRVVYEESDTPFAKKED